MKLLPGFLFVAGVGAFLPQQQQRRSDAATVGPLKGYIPDGMSAEQYRKLKQKEKEDMSKKRFGAFGPQSFKSRSLQSFQKDLEAGKADHLMPVLDAKKKLKTGEISARDIPYMQRLGSWDDSDLGAKSKKKWREEDKKYDQNAAPFRLDWSMGTPRTGPAANRKPQQQQQPKQKAPQEPKKKFFGLF